MPDPAVNSYKTEYVNCWGATCMCCRWFCCIFDSINPLIILIFCCVSYPRGTGLIFSLLLVVLLLIAYSLAVRKTFPEMDYFSFLKGRKCKFAVFVVLRSLLSTAYYNIEHVPGFYKAFFYKDPPLLSSYVSPAPTVTHVRAPSAANSMV